MNAVLYPVIVLMHLSDPTSSTRHEVTSDYFGAGIGIELRNGLSIEGTIGTRSIGCAGPDCGRSAGAQITFTWRGKRRG